MSLLAKDQADAMLTLVAQALGSELLLLVTFVGGCTTALHVSDTLTLQSIRFTDDVDIIVQVMGRAQWREMQSSLRKRGFYESINDDVVCRMRLGELKVDFMPDDASILGFTNRWYRSAIESAAEVQLQSGIVIRVVEPVHFVATKIEAYLGRGDGDLLLSHDVEDILTLFDGRPELVGEISSCEPALRTYIIEKLEAMLRSPDFEYAIQSTAASNAQREQVLFDRIKKVVGPARLELATKGFT